MKLIKLVALATVWLCLGASAFGQTYPDSLGTIVPGVAPIPFPYTPISPGQHNLAITSVTSLTVPIGARYAVVQAATSTVKYTTDGTTTPTSSVGMTLAQGASVVLSGPIVIANFKAISASGTLDVEYYR